MIVVWLALLAFGGLAMWTAVPLAWLWFGSQLDSGILTVGGAILTMVGWALLLAHVNRRYQRARVRHGLDDTGSFPLEVTLVLSAFVAAGSLVAFFLVFEAALGPNW